MVRILLLPEISHPGHRRRGDWGWLWPLVLTLGLGSGPTAALGQTTPSSPLPPAASASSSISGGRIVRPTLRLGSQGEAVKELQSMLMLLGYYSGPVSGLYQEDTQLAVQRFQRAAAISPDGIVGPATWSQLFPTPTAEAAPPTPANPAASGNGARPQPSQPPTPTTATTPSPPTTSAPSPSPSTGGSSASANLPVLRPGMQGEAVRQLQQKLRAKGVYSGPIDGIFGSQTEAAVRQVQRSNNLTVDGIVGPATWRVLN
ncbi:MAG TPA: peptidoglycan-binding protein [Leptolyngbyaceae cyanobacterium M65_K2018_010]|nr:peptidoglycan-binding protein [Leptolyngbyaceae cyanobacterium M65_K2018_010]